MKKYLIALYITGAILTNSYIRQYRIDEWDAIGLKEINNYKPVYKPDVDRMKMDNKAKCASATILWPVYIAARISDIIICTNVKVEAPEILQ